MMVETAKESEEIYRGEDSLEQIAKACRELGLDGGAVEVRRRRGLDLKFAYLDRMPIADLDIETLVRIKGGGCYRFRFYDSEGEYVTHKTLEIEETLEGEEDKARQAARAPIVTAPVGFDTKDFSQMLMTMLAQSQQQMQATNATMVQMCAAMAQRSERSALEQLAPLLTALTPLAQAWLTKMTAAAPPGSLKEAMELIKQAREIAGDDAPERGGIMETLLAGVANAIATRVNQPVPVPASSPSPEPAQLLPGAASPVADPAPVLPTYETGQATASGIPTMTAQELIRRFASGQRAKLSRAAQLGRSAESYADIIQDMLEDEAPEWMPVFIEMLQAPDWCQQIFGTAVLPFMPWFEELRETILEDQGGDEKHQQPEPKPDTIKVARSNEKQ